MKLWVVRIGGKCQSTGFVVDREGWNVGKGDVEGKVLAHEF